MNPERARMIAEAQKLLDPRAAPPPSFGAPSQPHDKQAPQSIDIADAAARAKQRALEIARKLSGEVLGKHRRDETGASGSGSRQRAERLRKKMVVPVEENPDINFLGLLIGPRGETQKRLESDSGAKILIRGKGSSKDGNDEDADEPLHVLIVADTDQQMDKATALVNELLYDRERRSAIKQDQLRKVAAYNGSLELMPSLYASETLAGESAAEFFGRAPRDGAGGAERKELMVPQERVGFVIGKGGETIKALQSKTGCRVNVSKDAPILGMSSLGEGECLVRQVTLSGSVEQIEACEQEIRQLIREKEMRGGRGVAFTQAPPSMSGAGGGDGSHYGPGASAATYSGGTTTVVINVPNDMVGLLIGKGGDTIRQLQMRSGAGIQVQRDSDVPPGETNRRVELSGSSEAIQAARQEIDNLINTQRIAHGMPSASGHQTNVMTVPNNAVGLIIGKGGETIKMLQMRTGARIQMARDQNAPEREVTLIGSPEQIEHAKQEITAICQQQHTASLGSGGGGGGGGGYGAGAYGYGQPYGGYGAPGYGGYGYGYGGYPAGYDPSAYYAQYGAYPPQDGQQQQPSQPPGPPGSEEGAAKSAEGAESQASQEGGPAAGDQSQQGAVDYSQWKDYYLQYYGGYYDQNGQWVQVQDAAGAGNPPQHDPSQSTDAQGQQQAQQGGQQDGQQAEEQQ